MSDRPEEYDDAMVFARQLEAELTRPHYSMENKHWERRCPDCGGTGDTPIRTTGEPQKRCWRCGGTGGGA